MGGTKKKSISQAEKAQAVTTKQEKSKEPSKGQKQDRKQFVISKIDDKEVIKTLGPLKAVTVQGVARTLGVNASTATSLIRYLESKNLLRKVGGYSGHYVYGLISG